MCCGDLQPDRNRPAGGESIRLNAFNPPTGLSVAGNLETLEPATKVAVRQVSTTPTPQKASLFPDNPGKAAAAILVLLFVIGAAGRGA